MKEKENDVGGKRKKEKRKRKKVVVQVQTKIPKRNIQAVKSRAVPVLGRANRQMSSLQNLRNPNLNHTNLSHPKMRWKWIRNPTWTKSAIEYSR